MDKALTQVLYFQNFLLLVQFKGHVRGDGVGNSMGVLNAGNRGKYFSRDFFVDFDVTLKGTEQRAHQCLDFLRSAVTFFQGSFQQRYSHHKAGISLGKTLNGHSLTPFDQHFDGAIG